MTRRSRKRREKQDADPPLAAMGDIAFLLIIFFILASNFAKEPPGKLELAKAPQLEILENTQVVVVIDDRDRIYMNGQEVDGAKTLELAVTELLEGVEESEKRVVQFKCDRNTSKAVFEPVIDALAKAGALIAIVGEEGDPREERRK